MTVWYVGPRKFTVDVFNELCDSPPRVVGIDFETPTLKDRIPIGVGIAFSPDESLYFPMLPSTSERFPWHILRNPEITKVYHNAPFDLSVMSNIRSEIDESNIGDTAVMLRLLLKPATLVQASIYVGYNIESAGDMLKENGIKTMLDIPEERLAAKCSRDARATLALYHKFIDQVPKEPYELEMKVIPILLEMSRKGLAIDQVVRQRMEDQFVPRVEEARALADDYGFNIASPQQVGYTLAKRGNVLPLTKSKRQLKADEATLKKYAGEDPMTQLVLKFREENYTLTHYILPYAEEERAYTWFHLDAQTWRVSSTKRNMNNIPKGDCRNMFLPDSGTFTGFDDSQLQLRILGYLSQDKQMLYAFENNINIHRQSAELMGVPYTPAKSTNFAMIFGATDETLAETAGCSIGRAKDLRNRWFSAYKEAADWLIQTQIEGVRTGKAQSIYGRDIIIPAEGSVDGMKRKAVNYPIQCSEAEIAKRQLVICSNLGFDLRIFLYDEILIDGEVELPVEELENIHPEIHTPIEIKMLERWE